MKQTTKEKLIQIIVGFFQFAGVFLVGKKMYDKRSGSNNSATSGNASNPPK